MGFETVTQIGQIAQDVENYFRTGRQIILVIRLFPMKNLLYSIGRHQRTA
jgi:hypothetical protein